MGIVKDYNRRVADAGRIDKVQALTAASTGTPVSNYGVTTISSTQAKTFQLAAPKAGLRKTICATGGSTAGDVTIDGNGATIGGSTAVAFANAVSSAVELVGTSTSAWAIVSNAGGTLS